MILNPYANRIASGNQKSRVGVPDVAGGQIETTEHFMHHASKRRHMGPKGLNSGTLVLAPALRKLVLQTHQMKKNVVATILTKPTIVYCNLHTV